MERGQSSLQYLSVGPIHYYYKTEIVRKDSTVMINLNQQNLKLSPTNTPSEMTKVEPVLKTIHCEVCGRNFSSEKALWGHKRCCKSKGNVIGNNKTENNTVSDCEPDVLDSGWSVTAKRGRKPIINMTSPEFIAASILIDMSKGKNDNFMIISHEREKKKAKIDDSQPLDEYQMTQIKCSKEFECTTCGKSFPTHQALGGHRASHKKDGVTVNSADLEVNIEENEQKGQTSGDHVCEICGRRFLIGQALGGHKRKHWTGPAFSPVSRVKTSQVEGNRIQESEVQGNRIQEGEVLERRVAGNQVRFLDLNEVARE